MSLPGRQRIIRPPLASLADRSAVGCSSLRSPALLHGRGADRELTTHEAADLPRVSRPHLVKLVERGDLPHHRTGDDPKAHRRLMLADVEAYDRRRRSGRRAALRELTQLSRPEGGYR